MRISAASTTPEILREIGERLQGYRVQQNLTVEELARRSGVSERTVNRTEAGENTSLENLIKLLRGLGRVDSLDAFLPVPLVSPLQLAETRGRERYRASGSRRRKRKRSKRLERSGTSSPEARGEKHDG